jgi:hypothetical protein
MTRTHCPDNPRTVRLHGGGHTLPLKRVSVRCPSAVKGRIKTRERFGSENLECARIVLADVERHGGEAAALVVWARLVNIQIGVGSHES